MARIAPDLLDRLQKHLNVKQARLYQLIQQTANKYMLERPEAALALAADHNLNISRWATREQRLLIAQARTGAVRVAEAPIFAIPAKPQRRALVSRSAQKKKGQKVFVVHGRNGKIKHAMFAFLRALHLQPIEWEKARALTGKANPYVGEILEKAFDTAAAVVVLLTPDDEARLKEELRGADDDDYESKLTGQPRPNVLYEAGFADAKYPDNSVIVAVGKLRPFSDIQGRHVLRLDNTAERRKELAARLKSAGLEADTDGNDWLKEGDFTL